MVYSRNKVAFVAFGELRTEPVKNVSYRRTQNLTGTYNNDLQEITYSYDCILLYWHGIIPFLRCLSKIQWLRTITDISFDTVGSLIIRWFHEITDPYHWTDFVHLCPSWKDLRVCPPSVSVRRAIGPERKSSVPSRKISNKKKRYWPSLITWVAKRVDASFVLAAFGKFE